ncbi:MAG: UDP-N-acetylglucosamine 2-epimerase (non-hydrolyzing) [Methanolobus sp.]|uniref:non-hydrolyzing UDP-N-acetylglucosamine 2-epimerase n=1 Tax=Methanolobus sp. TaxID=1874737 RepID=UPI0027306382|nr:UDP-N-acetylglucosamine 2-epimerase (non-hydrolyzing) [Methanolobus sp.]MDP2216449.1 UDP-N-acetylglucosamine 2-epimerase (non-hydrolyzing) [Methanolobus sp.]
MVLGTRPEIITMCPVIRECESRGLGFYILHTGQHYSFEMDRVFFEELKLPAPKYNMDVGSGLHGEQTGKMLAGIERVLLEDTPDVVLVQGDTNTVLAGALAASKLHIKVGHIEAGLRSFDRTMPEETNRIVADHISDYLFAPTENSKKYLLAEGIPEERIFVTGNTVADAVYQNLEISKQSRKTLERFVLKEGGYFLTTVHGAENTDKKERLAGILAGFEQIYAEFSLPIIFPAHPRTVKMIREFGLQVPEGPQVIDPVGYLDFLQLEGSAKLILTDSGGLQEEACILGVPCVTLRDNTERPETVEVGANVVCGDKSVIGCVKQMMQVGKGWKNPYEDAGERIFYAI